mmetsp:Transcript_25824/g.43308  ORF Transcript_25824/g.43308 Transcript_25824/m.43308 type:complete len:446 (-) Transcript_25824:90-1427(-)|eukprot:CAMPEP_0198202542 /NCGR_PEP_ID=MMETSP1445-20131203/5719_1 /TAXON_ID=36898 /ORGANISM="Pyramimonas sp., Strain CCMP2087" /LENGTH=445 /DNA_ID=CAMNT_0043873515 /DNA_START=138 /DNA_END=1478 /DNA_ORIENTATION=-
MRGSILLVAVLVAAGFSRNNLAAHAWPVLTQPDGGVTVHSAFNGSILLSPLGSGNIKIKEGHSIEFGNTGVSLTGQLLSELIQLRETVSRLEGLISAVGTQTPTTTPAPAAVVPPSASAPSVSCLPPNGRLTSNGTHFQCSCDHGFSGVSCEVAPSVSGREPISDSKVVGVRAIHDSGHNPSHAYGLSRDDDTSTFWESASDADQFIDFDLQASSVHISGFAVRSQGNGFTTPDECMLLVSQNSGGPWLQVMPFRMTVVYDWQFFTIPLSTPTRYARIFFENTHTPTNRTSRMQVSEVEFFQPNVGGFRTDAQPARCDPKGGSLTFMNRVWSCRCKLGWGGAACTEPLLAVACAAASGTIHNNLYIDAPVCQISGSSCPSGMVMTGAEWSTTASARASHRGATCDTGGHSAFQDRSREFCYALHGSYSGGVRADAAYTSVGCVLA